MNILMVCRQHPVHLNGGLAIASWNTAKLAHGLGHDVLYVTGGHPDGLSGPHPFEGIMTWWVERLSHEADGYAKLYKWLPANYDKLQEVFGEFDIIHSQSSGATPLINLDPHVPIVFQDHGTQLAAMQDDINMTAFGLKHKNIYSVKQYDNIYGKFTNFIEGKEIDYLRRFDAVLATSSISAWDLRTRYFLNNVHTFYHPIFGLTPEIRPAREKPVIAFAAFGLDTPQKSVRHGLEHLLPIKDRISIKLIGNGPAVTKWATENFPDVTATGYIPEKQVKEELASSDVLFESSCHHRGLNLTGITAIGLGVPVLAYPTAGHIDLTGADTGTFGPAGAIVDPFDNKSVLAALETLIEYREAFSNTASQHFQYRFAPEVAAKNLDSIYDSIAIDRPHMVLNPSGINREKKVARESIQVVVPPGIGDTVWIYMKLQSLGIPIDWVVCDSGDKNRTKPIMDLLPWARECVYSKDYKFPMIRKEGVPSSITTAELMKMPDPVLIECNTHLENHNLLKDWLPDMPIEYHVRMELIPEDVKKAEVVQGQGYLCIFCSAETTARGFKGWVHQEWLEFLRRFKSDVADIPIVLIGALWDAKFAGELTAMAAADGIEIQNTCAEMPLSATLDIIRRSKFFVSFPSGLGILSAIMRHPCIMFYGPMIGGIIGTFVSPEVAERGMFTEIVWEPPVDVIERIKQLPPFRAHFDAECLPDSHGKA